MRRWAVVAIAVLAAGCAGPAGPSDPAATTAQEGSTTEPPVVLPQCHNRDDAPSEASAHDAAALDALWRAKCGGPYPGPALDFERTTVAAYFWGRQPDASHGLRLVRHELHAEVLAVHVERVRECGPTAHVVVHPALVVALPHASERVAFHVRDAFCPA